MSKGVRLNFVVEGQTEEAFVNRILRPHLAVRDVWAFVRVVTTMRTRARSFKGGLATYGQAKKDVQTWMKEDGGIDSRFTTMFDLYALPADFPRFNDAAGMRDPLEKVRILEEALAEDISDCRFIPHLQLHEFEALLLSEPQALNAQFDDTEAIRRLASMAAQFESPEHIDDGVETAPSKRIISEIPGFGRLKASAGPIVARRIGLPTMRRRCRHFGEWISKLEGLAA